MTDRQHPARRIAVLATGGTIASRSTPSGIVPTLSVAEVISDVPVPDEVDVVAHEIMRKASQQLTMADLRRIQDAVRDVLALTGEDAVDGVVVTHGTDTLEETAFLLDLVHDDERPVVVTGAMRAADSRRSDGQTNLADAIAVAASDQARGAGVLVCLAGSVLAAEGTRKLHTLRLDTFGSVELPGPLGGVTDGDVTIPLRRFRHPPLPPAGEAFDRVRVDMVMVFPGADDVVLRACADAGASAVVLLGVGNGNANDEIVSGVRRLTRQGIVVAVGSRAPFGPTVAMYGDGGGQDLVDAGALMLHGLPPTQARVLLALLASQGLDPAAIAEALRGYTHPSPGRPPVWQ